MSGRFEPDPSGMRKIHQAAERAVADGIEYLGEEANRTAPIEEGTMIRTGRASTDGLRGSWSYDTAYSARQHEDTRLRHDAGRRAKWGERTWQEQAQRVGTFIADAIRRAL